MNKKLLCAVMTLSISLLTACGTEKDLKMPGGAEEAVQTAEPADAAEHEGRAETADPLAGHAGESSRKDSLTELLEEQQALFQQALLFLQQGFRQHDIQESYTVYFAESEEWNEQHFQKMLLEGEGGLWTESFTYTYDAEQDWYTFSGEYEPVLTKNDFYLERDDESAEAFRAASVYQTELSARTDIAVPLRFDIPAGPVVYDQPRSDGIWEDYLDHYIYVYQDERLGVTVEIEYPQYSSYTPGIEDVEALNQCIRDSFFYGYGSSAESWNPEQEMYSTINRSYEITRKDDQYFSVCIYEDNYSRGANHPNAWKSGMTIDLAAGQALTLKDVIGSERTVEELVETGAFHCLQIWKDAHMTPEEEEEADKRQAEEAAKYVDVDAVDDFYLTPDKLGLVGFISRYYVCMEAPYGEIGLNKWEAAHSMTGEE